MGQAWEAAGRELLAAAVHRDEIVQLGRRLVQIPSHPDYPAKERELAEFLGSFLEREKLEVRLEEVSAGRPNLIAVLTGTGGGRTLMFNAHLDTVPPYAMDIEPFGGHVEGGRLYGRGAVDVKGGLTAMAMAMAGLKRAGIRLAGDVVLAGVVDEEYRGEGTEAVILGGMRADGAIVAEPTGLRICRGHKGLEWLEITVHGRAVHSGSKERGVNAVSLAARLIVAMEERLVPRLAGRGDPFLGLPTLNVGFIQGGSQPSTVAGSCTLRLDRRTTPAESTALVWSDFEELFGYLAGCDPDFRAEICRMPNAQATMDHLAFVTPADHPLVTCLERAAAAVTGTRAVVAPFPAWSDAGFLAVHGGIPSVVLGPGDLTVAHSPVEWVDIDEVAACTELYALAAMAFCKGAQ